MSPPHTPKAQDLLFDSVCPDGSVHPQGKGLYTLPLLRIRYCQSPVLSVPRQDPTPHVLQVPSV